MDYKGGCEMKRYKRIRVVISLIIGILAGLWGTVLIHNTVNAEEVQEGGVECYGVSLYDLIEEFGNEYLLIELDESHFLVGWEKENVHVIMKNNKIVKICNSWENK